MNNFFVKLVCAIAISGSVNAQQLDPDAELVLATRGDAIVRMADVDLLLAGAPTSQRSDIVSSAKRVEQLLDSRLLAVQLSSKGRAIGLQNDIEVQRRLAIATEKAFGEIVLDVMVSRSSTDKLETLAKETYIAKKAEFVSPERWSVRHLLITSNDDENQAAFTARAERLYNEALKPSTDFTGLVKLESRDPSVAQNNGVFLVERKSEFDPEFLGAVVKLTKSNQFAPLTKTQFGYHIIKLLEKSEKKQLLYEEVRPKLMASLSESYRDRVKTEILSDLRSADPKYIEENIRKLVVRYDQPAPAAPPISMPATAPAMNPGSPK